MLNAGQRRYESMGWSWSEISPAFSRAVVDNTTESCYYSNNGTLLERTVRKLGDIKTLAELRGNKGFSQADVAGHLKITPQGYGAIERGERVLRVKYIKKLAEIFGVKTDLIVFLAIQGCRPKKGVKYDQKRAQGNR